MIKFLMIKYKLFDIKSSILLTIYKILNVPNIAILVSRYL